MDLENLLLFLQFVWDSFVNWIDDITGHDFGLINVIWFTLIMGFIMLVSNIVSDISESQKKESGARNVGGHWIWDKPINKRKDQK